MSDIARPFWPTSSSPRPIPLDQGWRTCGPHEHLIWPASEFSLFLLEYNIASKRVSIISRYLNSKTREVILPHLWKGRISGWNWLLQPASDIAQFIPPMIINRFSTLALDGSISLKFFLQTRLKSLDTCDCWGFGFKSYDLRTTNEVLNPLIT